MTRQTSLRQSALLPTGHDLNDELARFAKMNIDDLRALWRERRGNEPPAALSKDLIGRALAYWLQETRLGGISPHLRRLLVSVSKNGADGRRHLKVGSVIVREHQGLLHEVTVVPDGFCWQEQVYSSLSVVAQKITGTNWNGPRFFGLRQTAGTTSGTPRNRFARRP